MVSQIQTYHSLFRVTSVTEIPWFKKKMLLSVSSNGKRCLKGKWNTPRDSWPCLFRYMAAGPHYPTSTEIPVFPGCSPPPWRPPSSPPPHRGAGLPGWCFLRWTHPSSGAAPLLKNRKAASAHSGQEGQEGGKQEPQHLRRTWGILRALLLVEHKHWSWVRLFHLQFPVS